MWFGARGGVQSNRRLPSVGHRLELYVGLTASPPDTGSQFMKRSMSKAVRRRSMK
jgi:hypothetical protein